MASRTKKAQPPAEQPAATAKPILTPELKLRRLYQALGQDPKFAHLRYRHRLIAGHGKIKPAAMVIVEMPEANDEHIGVALTGPGGIVLAEMLSIVDLKRTDHLFVTPVIKYRTQAGREATRIELAGMLPYLEEEIEIVDPSFIIASGRYVTNLFFPKKKYADVINEPLPWKKRVVIPTVHPVSAAKDPVCRQSLVQTFKMIGEVV